jgi:hypothetical protein
VEEAQRVIDHFGMIGGHAVLLEGVGGQVEEYEIGEPMEGAVVGTNTDPRAEPQRPPSRPRGVGRHEMVPSADRAGGKPGGERCSVPAGRYLSPEQLEHGRHHVDLIVEP